MWAQIKHNNNTFNSVFTSLTVYTFGRRVPFVLLPLTSPTTSLAKWELGVLLGLPAGCSLLPSAPSPSPGSCRADCQLFWQPDLPGKPNATSHRTRLRPRLALNHPRSRATLYQHPPRLLLDTTWKREAFVWFTSIYSPLCFCSVVGWGVLEDWNANIKQYTAIILHPASAGTLSLFVIRLETRMCTACINIPITV